MNLKAYLKEEFPKLTQEKVEQSVVNLEAYLKLITQIHQQSNDVLKDTQEQGSGSLQSDNGTL